jgi:hypothetical protein
LLVGEGSKNLVLLGSGLEATVTDLGGGINKLKINLLGLPGLGGGEDRLSDNERSLAGSLDATLEKEEVVIDLTVVGEATERSDVLLNGVVVASGVVLNTSLSASTNTVDLVVDLGSGVVAKLTSAGHSPLDGSWMPSTDTSDLSETSVSLAGKLLDTKSLHDTLHTVTSGNTNSVAAVIVLEDLTDLDLLLEVIESPFDLVGDLATVKLDFHDVSLVLTELEKADLGSDQHTDNRAVLLDAFKVAVDGAGALGVILESVGVLGECLLLGVGPVSVEAALDVGVKVLGPDGGQLAEATGGLNVTNEADDLNWRAFDDGGGLNDVLLEDLLTLTTLVVLNNVGHASLIADEGGKMDWLGGVILGEVTATASVLLCASLGHEGQRAVSGVFELSA